MLTKLFHRDLSIKVPMAYRLLLFCKQGPSVKEYTQHMFSESISLILKKHPFYNNFDAYCNNIEVYFPSELCFLFVNWCHG